MTSIHNMVKGVEGTKMDHLVATNKVICCIHYIFEILKPTRCLQLDSWLFFFDYSGA